MPFKSFTNANYIKRYEKSNKVMCLINKARDGASHLVWSTSKRDVKSNGQGNSGRNKLTNWVNISSSVVCVVRGSKGKYITGCYFVCLFAKDSLVFAIYYSSYYARKYARRHESISIASLDFLNLSFLHLLNFSPRSRETTILSEWIMG